MPTTRPRYTFTDTGHLREVLDAAQRRWPGIADRKALLMRLAEEGHRAYELSDDRRVAEERDRRTRAALRRIPRLVDVELLLSDRAWL